MKILVSACLLGIDCKYNGKNNKNDKIIELDKITEKINLNIENKIAEILIIF